MLTYCCGSGSEKVKVEQADTDEMRGECVETSPGTWEPNAELDSSLAPSLLYENDPNMFYVSLVTFPEQGLGLDLDLLDATGIMVNDVLGGAAKSWNTHADLRHQVCYGDRIMEVNGTRGSSQDHLEILRDDENVKMWLKRPVAVRIRGNASLNSIGLEIICAADSSTLLIERVTEGIVEDWNVDNPDFAVHQHDRIVEVNGTTGFATELMRSLRNLAKLELLIFCYNV